MHSYDRAGYYRTKYGYGLYKGERYLLQEIIALMEVRGTCLSILKRADTISSMAIRIKRRATDIK